MFNILFSLRFTVIINGHTSYHDGKYYETCPDCLLSEDTTLLPDGKSKGRYLFLFSKALFLSFIVFLSVPFLLCTLYAGFSFFFSPPHLLVLLLSGCSF